MSCAAPLPSARTVGVPPSSWQPHCLIPRRAWWEFWLDRRLEGEWQKAPIGQDEVLSFERSYVFDREEGKMRLKRPSKPQNYGAGPHSEPRLLPLFPIGVAKRRF